jgi:hypothetical protein
MLVVRCLGVEFKRPVELPNDPEHDTTQVAALMVKPFLEVNDLRLLRSVLNEVLNGFTIDDFDTAIGIEKVEVQKLLRELNELPDEAGIGLDRKQAVAFRNCLHRALSELASKNVGGAMVDALGRLRRADEPDGSGSLGSTASPAPGPGDVVAIGLLLAALYIHHNHEVLLAPLSFNENNDASKGDPPSTPTPRDQERASEAASGDTTRQVGDPNRVVLEGRTFIESLTGNRIM